MAYYEYDANNRLISSNDGRQTTTYAYDANGNMLRSDGEKTTDYIFNTEYDYDPFGKLEDDENEWMKLQYVVETTYDWDGTMRSTNTMYFSIYRADGTLKTQGYKILDLPLPL